MTTKREQIFEALFALWAPLSASVSPKRNDVLPERLDNGALPLLIQQDGADAPPPVETTLSPLTFLYEENVELQLAAQGAVATTTPTLDTIIAAIGTALAAHRTLGGLADDVRAVVSPKIEDRAIAGATPLRVATVTIRIAYSSTDPLI